VRRTNKKRKNVRMVLQELFCPVLLPILVRELKRNALKAPNFMQVMEPIFILYLEQRRNSISEE
jgi:hypothetical protein